MRASESGSSTSQRAQRQRRLSSAALRYPEHPRRHGSARPDVGKLSLIAFQRHVAQTQPHEHEEHHHQQECTDVAVSRPASFLLCNLDRYSRAIGFIFIQAGSRTKPNRKSPAKETHRTGTRALSLEARHSIQVLQRLKSLWSPHHESSSCALS